MENFSVAPEKFLSRYDQLIQDENYYYLYKHVAIDREKLVYNIFDKCQLKFTQPINFNDPYDCLFSTKIDFSKFNRKSFQQVFDTKIKHTDWLKNIGQYKKRLSNLFNADETMDKIRSKFSVTCFNANPLNMLMWSHYTNHHQGFMIEFRFPKNEDCQKYSNLQMPLPIIYTEEYPVVNFPWMGPDHWDLDSIDLSEIIKNMILVKSLDWEYEREFRSMHDLQCDGIIESLLLKFNPKIISSVIFGAKINNENKLDLKEKINNLNSRESLVINTYEASLVTSKYRIQIMNHPRLN